MAATEDRDSVLVIFPEDLQGRERTYQALEGTVTRVAKHWSEDAYVLAPVPQISEIQAELKGRGNQWEQFNGMLEQKGIYLSGYAGGTAFILKPLETTGPVSDRGAVSTTETQHIVDVALAEINNWLESTGVRQKLHFDLQGAEKVLPPFPATLSAYATSFRKADELRAWEEIGDELQQNNGPQEAS